MLCGHVKSERPKLLVAIVEGLRDQTADSVDGDGLGFNAAMAWLGEFERWDLEKRGGLGVWEWKVASMGEWAGDLAGEGEGRKRTKEGKAAEEGHALRSREREVGGEEGTELRVLGCPENGEERRQC